MDMDVRKQFATMISGRQYGNEITKAEAELAKKNGVVIVYGYSDDNMEFEGAIYDEVGCFNGGKCYIKGREVFHDEPYDGCPSITAVWCGEGKPPWTYETDILHETFEIYEGEELFCVGIVFTVL
jgi:hypothetical protein